MRKAMMGLVVGLGLGLSLGVVGASANAAETNGCKAGLVCAAEPETIAKVIKDAGYRAVLGKDSSGDPMISSAASGYDFNIYFYGCTEGKACQSLQFSVSFADDGKNTIELANLWNRKRRFSQMAVDEDGSLDLTYDVTTVGGLTEENLADVVDWWQTMLGALNTFFRQQGHID